MQIDKLIKREVIMLLIFIAILLIMLLIFAYTQRDIFSISNNDNIIKINNLELVFCSDKTCQSSYENKKSEIGTTKLNGNIIPNKLITYKTSYEALKSKPYVFSIKNTSEKDIYINIKLEEDKSCNYKDNLKIAINDCINIPIEKTYINLNNNKIIENESIASDEIKKYCLWLYLDENFISEEDVFFISKLNIETE